MKFKTFDEFIEYRVSMKRGLIGIGCQLDGSESTEMLEEMVRINGIRIDDDEV